MMGAQLVDEVHRVVDGEMERELAAARARLGAVGEGGEEVGRVSGLFERDKRLGRRAAGRPCWRSRRRERHGGPATLALAQRARDGGVAAAVSGQSWESVGERGRAWESVGYRGRRWETGGGAGA